MENPGMPVSTWKVRIPTRAAMCAMGALMALGASSAMAQESSDAAEIRALKARLSALEHKMSEQARETKEVRRESRAAAKTNGAQGHYVKGGPIDTCAPGAWCYKGLTLTPGGFAALEGVYRSHNEQSDIGSNFNAIPFGNNQIGNNSEARFSARQSRASLLVEGRINPATRVSAYGEFDFLGAGQTANSNESNSYQPRIRHLYAAIDQDAWGTHVLAGQNWSLTTLNGFKGIVQRDEQIPLTIDAQYVPGFTWTRQPQVRVVQDLGYGLHAALSVENGQTTLAGTLPNGLIAFSNNSCGFPGVAQTNPSGYGLLNACNNYWINGSPDFIGKLSWAPELGGHKINVQGFGMLRDLSNRTNGAGIAGGVPYPVASSDTWTTGFGGGVLAQVIPNVLDLQFSATTGHGIGRYGSGQLADATYNVLSGRLAGVKETQMLAGLIFHAMNTVDFYVYAGQEVAGRTAVVPGLSGATYGYGNPYNLNTGCQNATAIGVGACAGATKSIQQLTLGAWDTVAKGDYGTVKVGAQYSFTKRSLFADVTGYAPTANESMGLISLRYYPFQ